MASTGSTSLSKRVARRNCFKSRIFQLNGKTDNSESNVIHVNFEGAAVAA